MLVEIELLHRGCVIMKNIEITPTGFFGITNGKRANAGMGDPDVDDDFKRAIDLIEQRLLDKILAELKMDVLLNLHGDSALP